MKYYLPTGTARLRFVSKRFDTGAPTDLASETFRLDIYRSGERRRACQLSRGSTDTAVASTAFFYAIDGTPYSKAAVAAGTALAAGTIPSDATGQWGLYLLSINAAGAFTFTAAAANFTTGYDNEAAALAAIPATPADEYAVGIVTVQAADSNAFVGGTDALAGGTGGTPAQTTNYYTLAELLASGSPPGALTYAGEEIATASHEMLVDVAGVGAGATADSQDEVEVSFLTGTVNGVSIAGDPAGVFGVAADALSTAVRANIKAEADSALTDYDAPTKAELDVLGTAALATASALATVDSNVDAVLLDTAEIGAAGAGLTEAGGTGDHLTALATASALSSVASDVTTLLGRITSTLFSGITSMAQWLGLIAGKQVGDTTARTELRATGAGSGTYDETTDSQEAIRDTAPLGTAMRGTDNAALASVATEARLAELDAANVPADVDTLLTRVVGTLATGTHNPQSGDAFARLGAPAGASVSADIAANQADLDTIITQRSVPAKGGAFTFTFKMVDATDFATPETGLTVTATRSLDGAAFGSATGTVTEIANGLYQMAASAADMNANSIVFRFTATGAAATEVAVITDGGV